MDKLSSDIFLKIITFIIEYKNKENNDLKNKILKLTKDLNKEKIKISKIKCITSFSSNYFCCDLCYNIYTIEKASCLFNILESQICIYCQNNSEYIEEILELSIIYIIENIIEHNTNTYNNYNEIPKRYRKNPIFTIKKYYYNDINKLLEDTERFEIHYKNANIDIIQKGVDLTFDCRFNKNFEYLLKQQIRLILNK